MLSDIVSLQEIDKAIIGRKIDLTPFEEDFIVSVRWQIESQTHELSKKQRQILGRIQSKILKW